MKTGKVFDQLVEFVQRELPSLRTLCHPLVFFVIKRPFYHKDTPREPAKITKKLL
jgi:hypothetical protein